MATMTDTAKRKGWAVDADPQNDPTYPMKHRRQDADHMGIYDWERPPLQEQKVEILQSIERPSLSATFGTPVPPSGLSGRIRRWAYTRSESTYSRWLPLILADRINVVEGVLHDLSRGHVPNIFQEMGARSEWRYNRRGFVKKAAIVGGVTLAAILLIRR